MKYIFNSLFKLSAAFMLCVLVFSTACSDLDWDKPEAFGRQKEILVICDDDLWVEIEKPLRREVERPLHAVRWEPIFEIAQVNQENVQHYKEWDKIILVESLENVKLLRSVVTDSTMEKLRDGEGLFFNQIDVWAEGQRVVGLAAPTDAEIPRLVVAHGERIFDAFIRQVEAQEMYRMYHSGPDTLLADSLAVAQGFSIELPNVYEQIRQDSLPENELLFVHQEPVRSIFITWEENPGPLDMSRDSLSAGRARRIERVYPAQVTITERIDTTTVEFNGLKRKRVYGIWENREQISGGIYVSHIIESPEQNRRYYLDCLLFSPDMRKNKYRFIFQLDHILSTFQLHLDHQPPAQGRHQY